jgi:ABC-type dipeptide/oligopeptide/nickel transport system permease component
VLVIKAAHRLVLNLGQKEQLQTAEQMADRLSLTAQLICTLVTALAFIGQARGWMHGTFRDVVLGVLVLFLVAAPVYWYGGRRRLIALLEPRFPGDAPEPQG